MKKESTPTPVSQPKFMPERVLIKQLLALVPGYRVGKLELISGRLNKSYQLLLLKRIDEIKRQECLDPLREMIMEDTRRLEEKQRRAEEVKA